MSLLRFGSRSKLSKSTRSLAVESVNVPIIRDNKNYSVAQKKVKVEGNVGSVGSQNLHSQTEETENDSNAEDDSSDDDSEDGSYIEGIFFTKY